MRPNPGCQKACQEETLDARPARLATTNVIDWKLEQKEDPVLYQVVKHRKASCETFKEALLKVTDQKATAAYVKSKEQLCLCKIKGTTDYEEWPLVQAVQTRTHRGDCVSICCSSDSQECSS